MKPLSLTLIEQIFSFMIPLGFTTYEIEIEKEVLLKLQNDIDGQKGVSVEIFWPEGKIIFTTGGMTLIFFEKPNNFSKI